MSGTDLLDLTQISENERLDKLLAALDALSGDQAIEVATGPDWDGLLAALQAKRPEQFEWMPLEKSADRWLASMVRVTSSNGIAAFMTRDHRRCDEIYAALENAGDDQQQEAIEQCQRFLMGMEHHFKMEENVLFPAFEDKTGMRQGPTMVMRMEHEQMRNLFSQMRQCAEQKNMDGLLKAGGTLLFLMQQHNVKEEQMLYPMAQSHLLDEGGELILSMQRQ